MAFLEYETFDGLGLAKLVHNGEISAEELVEAAIERAEKHDPDLNALVYKMYDLARDAARKSDADHIPAPFRGVPFLLKDLMGNHAGVPTTCGSRFMCGAPTHLAPDSELVARFKRAGLLPIAKTASSEFGCTPTAESDLYGDCRNPWSLDHSTGGSSGGSAAAVAAGIVPIAHATDGGGSIRIPASCCGLVGMKPTRARNSLAPLVGDVMNGMVVEHAVSRTVRDSAALLDCTAGSVTGDPYMAPPQERPYLEEVLREPGSLRIATWSKSIRDTEIDPECRAATENTAALLSELGHEVEEAFPPINTDLITNSILTVWAAGTCATIDLFQLGAGRAPAPEFFEPITWALYERGQSISASEYQRAVAFIQITSRQIGEFFETFDVWLTPTLEKPPLAIGAIDRHETDLDKAFAPILEYATYTPIFNATGQPAVSLPLHWTPSGLPVGVHFAGRFGDEATLFRLAAQLEKARPWHSRKPPTSEPIPS
jgi:amidase